MNIVELVGDLACPVEVQRDTMTGRTVAKVIVAVARGVHGPDFVPCTLWGREASDAGKHLEEGSRVAIKGQLRSVLVPRRNVGGARRMRRVLYVDVDRLTYLTVQPPRERR
jgi:single-stranded DNA-binding protein